MTDIRARRMKLAIFDIDGTLTQTMAVTDALFVQAVCEVIGSVRVSRDWSSYPHQRLA
jgi:beta-phosphoglucomutase-like phosphatase (HAD superfamily)